MIPLRIYSFFNFA